MVPERPIVEVKRRLDGSESHFECDAIVLEERRRAVILYVIDRAWSVSGIALRRGMRTYGHFWLDRNYNAYHWLDGERTVGVYFNIGVCHEISRERVLWTDYAVDVLAAPDGSARVLDEEELGIDTPADVLAVVRTTRALILAELRSLLAEVEAETRRLLAT